MRASLVFLVSSLFLAAALGFTGWSMHRGFQEFGMSNRVVTVKGLAERDVRADVAIWPLPIAATANDLAEAQASIDSATQKATMFLKGKGFADSDIKIQKTEVTDLLAQAYRSSDSTQLRYIIRQYLLVETKDIDLVIRTQSAIGELLKQGVVIETAQTNYVYRGLNDIKPDMIAEATKNAREGAVQFARDSNAKLGGIKRASQGQFQILPADSEFQYNESQSPNKKVRVVNTVEYFLVPGGE